MKSLRSLPAIVSLIVAMPAVGQAQDSSAPPVFNDFLNVSVDANISRLETTVGAVAVRCEVVSFFSSNGSSGNHEVVGEAMVVLHGGMFDVGGRPIEEAMFEKIPYTEFRRLDRVFGNGGTRQIDETVELTLGPVHSPSRIEEWSTGACHLELFHESETSGISEAETIEMVSDEFYGSLPEECMASTPTRLFNCIRPGTSPETAVFTFERDF
ncbi:MAG: hypothetical protein CMH12_21325 [Maritimibacter sp.]|nr:hypothetical protein [Maritimibacter sp.]